MDRRSFVAAAGTAALAASAAQAQAGLEGRDLYELRRYTLKAGERQAAFDAYLKTALLPALDRLDVMPVGVFKPVTEGPDPVVFVLAVHGSPETIAMVNMLSADPEFAKAAAPYLDFPPADPLYKRVESSLMLAFTGQPRLAVPKLDKPRIFELRCYESHNERSAAKKIDMFNNGEIPIFARAGLAPVFFGQTLAGAAMPNLTYMITCENDAARAAGWKAFGADPEWKTMSGKPEYQNIVSHITSTVLAPTDFSKV
ncbi:MAG: NIPSNAP family protein [Armatimonadetes bacterium]|nr:NIPSNAP family protein [Armatimonadota bacterium]